MQHLHILGICGTFMGSLAQLALAKGYRVTGCDANVYPPMSTQLERAGIELITGFGLEQLALEPDLYVIGNAMSRGNPLVEAILNRGLAYTSGPRWLHDVVLPGRWVLAIAGTHGKTSTSSMLAWILDYAGLSPGFLIGGVPANFSVSARLGDTPFFVIEADEYDSAFFDKRSKFIHYQPRTLVINNIEFDHADIFDDLAAIQKQFHHLVRLVPEIGLVIRPENSAAIDAVIAQGCWTPIATINTQVSPGGWSAQMSAADGSCFHVLYDGAPQAMVNWEQLGEHGVANALAAIAAAHHVGVTADIAVEALGTFTGVKRRMETLAEFDGIHVYDDFAHHPTAIKTTLTGLRKKVGNEQIIALIEPRSNTMRMGIQRMQLAAATAVADQVLWYQAPELAWDIRELIENSTVPTEACESVSALIERTRALVTAPTHIVIMSNGGFGGIHQLLINELKI